MIFFKNYPLNISTNVIREREDIQMSHYDRSVTKIRCACPRSLAWLFCMVNLMAFIERTLDPSVHAAVFTTLFLITL